MCIRDRVSTYKQSGMDRFVCQIWIASSLIVSLLDTELVESTPILHPEPQSNSPQHPGRQNEVPGLPVASVFGHENVPASYLNDGSWPVGAGCHQLSTTIRSK